MRVFGEVLEELALVELHEADDLGAALHESLGGEVDLEDPGHDARQRVQVLLVEVGELLLRKDRLHDVQHRVHDLQAGLQDVEVPRHHLGGLDAVRRLMEQVRRQVLYHIVHLRVEVVRPEHVPVLLAQLLQGQERVVDPIRDS